MADKKMRWNLEDILSWNNIDSKINELESMYSRYDEFYGQMHSDMSTKTFLEYSNFELGLMELYCLIKCRALFEFEIDSRKEDAWIILDRLRSFDSKFSEVTSNIISWIMGIDEKWKKGLDDENAVRLSNCLPETLRYKFIKERKEAKYILSSTEERIITIKDATGIEILLDIKKVILSNLTFAYQPENKPLISIKTLGELDQYYESCDSSERKAAFFAKYVAFKDQVQSLGIVYLSVVKDFVEESKLRGYSSPIAKKNLEYDLPDSVVETLLSFCGSNVSQYHRYLKWKAKELGKDKLDN